MLHYLGQMKGFCALRLHEAKPQATNIQSLRSYFSSVLTKVLRFSE